MYTLIFYLFYWPVDIYFVYILYSFYMRVQRNELDYEGNFIDLNAPQNYRMFSGAERRLEAHEGEICMIPMMCIGAPTDHATDAKNQPIQ